MLVNIVVVIIVVVITVAVINVAVNIVIVVRLLGGHPLHLGHLQAAVYPVLCFKLGQPTFPWTTNVHCGNHIPEICQVYIRHGHWC